MSDVTRLLSAPDAGAPESRIRHGEKLEQVDLEPVTRATMDSNGHFGRTVINGGKGIISKETHSFASVPLPDLGVLQLSLKN